MFQREIFIIFIIFFLASVFGCTNPNTPAGHEGFVYEKPRIFGKGGFRGVTKGPGNYGVSLWRNEVINIDLRPNTYAEKFKILAKDDLNVSFRFHAIISLNPGSVKHVVQKYGGKNWYKRFVKEPFRTFVRNAVQQYDSRAIKEKRDIIANEVKSKMENHLKSSPFQLVSLVVGNIDYPDVVAKAVEEKLAAQQLLEEKKVQKEIAKSDGIFLAVLKGYDVDLATESMVYNVWPADSVVEGSLPELLAKSREGLPMTIPFEKLDEVIKEKKIV